MYFLISGGADTLSVFIMDYVVGSTKSIGIIPPVARGNYTVIDISLGPAFLAGNGSALKLERPHCIRDCKFAADPPG